MTGLSTRGYAGTSGKEMIAGLNVQGTAGQPKRIIIRALGPTLTRQGVSSAAAMEDPMLELHLADGTLLLANDDWASDSVVTNGTRDDFQPIVTYYQEKDIQSTGFAPSNRREPAIMVDLLPGIYSVVVKPFEKAASGSSSGQTASPGVALVEVYELSADGKVD